MSATVSVIIPSVGRATLARAIASCVGAYEVLTDVNEDGDRGYLARERLIRRATGEILAFTDDDDVLTPNAIAAFSGASLERPTFFRMKYGHGDTVIWNEPELRFGNIGTPCICVPNIPAKLGKWEAHHGSDTGGDYVFASGCVERMGEPFWDETIVAIIRPDA